jgi:hypothetical protein
MVDPGMSGRGAPAHRTRHRHNTQYAASGVIRQEIVATTAVDRANSIDMSGYCATIKI